MTIYLKIAGLCIEINSERELEIDDNYFRFLTDVENTPRIRINFIWDANAAPQIPCDPIGKDIIQTFYKKNDIFFCTLVEKNKKCFIITKYDSAYDRFDCYIDPGMLDYLPMNLSTYMRAIPMRALLQHFGVLFFHASQIAVGDTGVLFAAPSGTGKTTQAKLWRQHRNARIICNDRTLVRDDRTYGFPIDGSEPVMSGEVHDLGAIVLLSQNSENSIQRLRPRMALARLLPQLVIDSWDSAAQKRAMEQLLELLSRCPVYLLNCTPDIDAVECLERQLIADGVIR